jgi:hypothetical protein
MRRSTARRTGSCWGLSRCVAGACHGRPWRRSVAPPAQRSDRWLIGVYGRGEQKLGSGFSTRRVFDRGQAIVESEPDAHVLAAGSYAAKSSPRPAAAHACGEPRSSKRRRAPGAVTSVPIEKRDRRARCARRRGVLAAATEPRQRTPMCALAAKRVRALVYGVERLLAWACTSARGSCFDDFGRSSSSPHDDGRRRPDHGPRLALLSRRCYGC